MKQFDGSGTLVDQVLADEKGTSDWSQAGISDWLFQDEQQSVRAIVTDASSILYQAAYDSFGLTTYSVSGSGHPGPNPTIIGYAGAEVEGEAGLLRMGQRLYRYLSNDPALSTSNLYVYAGNDPIDNTDPTGLYSFSNGGGYSGGSLNINTTPGYSPTGASLGGGYSDAYNSNSYTNISSTTWSAPTNYGIFQPGYSPTNTPVSFSSAIPTSAGNPTPSQATQALKAFITPSFAGSSSGSIGSGSSGTIETAEIPGGGGSYVALSPYGSRVVASPAEQGIAANFFSGVATRAGGLVQAGVGLAQAAAGAAFAAGTEGAGAIPGYAFAVHGLDNFATGLNTLFTGQANENLTSQAAVALTGDERAGPTANVLLDFGLTPYITPSTAPTVPLRGGTVQIAAVQDAMDEIETLKQSPSTGEYPALPNLSPANIVNRPVIEGVIDSPRTPLHSAAQRAYAEALQESGLYQRVSQGSINLSEFSGLSHSPDIKPDVMGLTHGGQIDMYEILSPSQAKYPEYVNAKLEKAMNQLPPEMRGAAEVRDPVKLLRGE